MPTSATEQDQTQEELLSGAGQEMEDNIDLDQQEMDEIKSPTEEDQIQDQSPTEKKSMWKARKQKIIGATRMRYNLLIHRSKNKLENSPSFNDVHAVSQQPDISFKRIKKLNRKGGDGASDQSADGQRDGSQDGSDKSLGADDRSDDEGNDKFRRKRHRHRHRNKPRAKTMHDDRRDLHEGQEGGDDNFKLTDGKDVKSKRRGREQVKNKRQRKQAIEMVSTDQMASIIQKGGEQESEFSSDDLDDDLKDSPSSDDGVYVRIDSGQKKKKKSKKYLDVSLPSITTKPRSHTYHPIYHSSSKVDKDDDNVSVKSKIMDGDYKSTLPVLVHDDKKYQSDVSSIRGGRSRASSRDYNATSALKSTQLDTKQRTRSNDSDDSPQGLLKEQTKSRDVKFADIDSSSDHSSETYGSLPDRLDEKKESADKIARVNRALELLKSIDQEISLVRQDLKDEAEEMRSTTRSSPKRSRQKQAKTDSVLSSFNAGLAFINSLKSRNQDHDGRQLSSAPTTEKEEKTAILRKTDQFRVDYTKLYANKFIHDDR